MRSQTLEKMSETVSDRMPELPEVPKFISPAAHAVLDYGVASTYFALWAKLRHTNSAAASLACTNGVMVLGLALMTDYPGGVFRTLSFKGHRVMDLVQAATAGLGPVLLGFAGKPEALPFYTQAATELGVVAATDWDARASASAA